jgi:hypothetical protein
LEFHLHVQVSETPFSVQMHRNDELAMVKVSMDHNLIPSLDLVFLVFPSFFHICKGSFCTHSFI